ncbi:Ribonuclease H-like domain,HAT, C-terminal dimerisation domain,Domain of unknown function DUF4371 [Cinara cedri]|uniref:Zinc finger MYM-type protein 1-like n=1 Tax=Cinara cedri TaxID=506608 RepID=A0A5E4M527_9HEMI|nr:Ribonuclease H-like domain,HAT, C-terminal dimerisation domain,Domain of unknown function DUF4371 [Cinara cedri]
MEIDETMDFLLAGDYRKLTYEQKCRLKGDRPTPDLQLACVDGKSTRHFQRSWYDKFPWLAGCSKRNKMFCFTCMMFGGDAEWCVDGVSSLKNILRKSEKHGISKKHLKNQEKFHLLGRVRIEHAVSEIRKLDAMKHNEQVGINRRLLARIMHVVCFLAKQEIAFRGRHDCSEPLNQGNYLELLELFAQEELLLKDHFLSSPTFKGITCNAIQNDLIECVTSVLNSRIVQEIQTVNHLSIQVDETTDVSCRSQISIIVRYAVEQNIVERFIGFFDVPMHKTASCLADVILNEINKWRMGNKIICQTYDGASVMSAEKNGVQFHIKQIHPNASFIHSYAHQLNLVLLHGAKTIKTVKNFICNLTMFRTFFSRSTKRSELLRERGFKLPNKRDTKWNYNSRAADTIKTHFSELKNAVIHVTEAPGWDPVSVCTASGLYDKLNDAEFVYLLILFSTISVYADYEFNFNTITLSNIQSCVSEIENLKHNLADLKKDSNVDYFCEEAIKLNNNLEYDEEKRNELRKITYEILDALIVQINMRFEDFSRLEFIEVINNKMFSEYHKKFPESKFVELIQLYPNTFDADRLRNELAVIYADVKKHLPPHELLDLIIKNDLQVDIYPEVTKLCQLVLTIPITAASGERSASTLKRIKTFLSNTMENDQRSNLSTLVIEKNLLDDMMKDPTFTESVFNMFAAKNPKIKLVYVKI